MAKTYSRVLSWWVSGIGTTKVPMILNIRNQPTAVDESVQDFIDTRRVYFASQQDIGTRSFPVPLGLHLALSSALKRSDFGFTQIAIATVSAEAVIDCILNRSLQLPESVSVEFSVNDWLVAQDAIFSCVSKSLISTMRKNAFGSEKKSFYHEHQRIAEMAWRDIANNSVSSLTMLALDHACRQIRRLVITNEPSIPRVEVIETEAHDSAPAVRGTMEMGVVDTAQPSYKPLPMSSSLGHGLGKRKRK